jgi:hypothetical protein
MRALQKAPENRYPDLSEMRNALVVVIQTPPPPLAVPRANEEEKTLVLPRGETPVPGAPVGPLTPPSQYMAVPPHSVTIPPPSAFMTSPYAAAPAAPAGMNDQGAGVGGGAPVPPAWGIKKKLEPAAPSKPSVEARTGTATHKSPVPTSRQAPARPVTRRRASRRRWMLAGGVAVAVIAGAIAAVPLFTRPEPTPVEREGPGIEAAMERYRVAYRNRDLEAIATAFPTVPENMRQKMQRTFESCLVYEVLFDGVQMQVVAGSDTRAEVTLHSTHTCTPQSDGRQTTTTQDETFTLSKNGEAWVISGVKSSPGAP